tara:strand:- start:149 stop:1051 length:903 start_codon:yes stop_codon:yes gene_type:complete
MATRGEQKIDEKKLQKAVESWVKQNRAKIADQRMQAAVDDFVKQHRKEVGDRGMRIIRRVISEGRTKPAAAKPMTASRSGPTSSNEKPIRAENRRGTSKSTAEKAIKTATDKAKSTVSAASRVGKLAKGMTGVGALLTASEAGAGSDVVPAGRRDEFVKKMDAERKAKEEAKKTEAKPAPKAESKPKPTPKPENKATTEAKKKAAMEKARATDRAGVESRKETARKENARREALRAHNKRITAMSPEERKKYRESEAGKSGKLLKNRGGSVSKYSSGGMAQRANCGASMKPTQKSSRGIK